MTVFTRSMQLIRDSDPGNKNRFLKVVDTCNAFSKETRLRYIFNGIQYETYSSHAEILKAWAAMNRFNVGEMGQVFMLTTDDKEPFFVLGPLDRDPYTDIAGIEFSFNVKKPLLTPGGFFSFFDCKEFFIAVINSYQAYAGFIHDADLEQLVSFGYVNRNIKLQVPEDEWKYIPVPDIVKATPPLIAEKISNVFPPHQFNRLEIPEAIYWFNYWNPYMVEHVGEEKIRTAPCEVVEKQKNGGYLIIVQKENLDLRNAEHLKKLAAAYDHFDLYNLQQKNLFR